MTTRTYRVKLYLSKAAHVALDDQLRAQARLYNAALEERRWAYKMAGESVTFVLQSRELTQVRVDDPEYAAVHRTIQVATLRRLDRAFQNFFRRVKKGEKPGYPRFKSSRRWRSLVCDNNIQARSMVKLGDNGKGKVRIKGLPPMEFRCKRELPPIDNLMELRVIKSARRVEAQLVFTTEAEDPEPVRHPERPVGVDVGVNAVVALSDGSTVPGRNEDRRRTRRLQRRLSRAKKGGHNRRKRVTALAKHRQRQGEARKGWAHEISAGLVKRYDFIAVEDLAIKNMVRSASGTVEDPGTNVKAKAGLNRRIQEQAWGDLIAKVAYKAGSAGVRLVAVDPRNTSQACSGCGALVPKALSVRVHHCPDCGLTLDRDVNAARNILRRGLEAHAAGGNHTGVQVGCLSTAPVGAGLHRNPITHMRVPDA